MRVKAEHRDIRTVIFLHAHFDSPSSRFYKVGYINLIPKYIIIGSTIHPFPLQKQSEKQRESDVLNSGFFLHAHSDSRTD